MPLLPYFPRRHVSVLVLAGVTALLFPSATIAQTNVPTLFLRPHCEEIDQSVCPLFAVQDPTTLITPKLAVGETLDIDLVLSNPNRDAIQKSRIWISYDAEALEGKTITLFPAFPTVVPGESDFSPLSGTAKIAASTEAGKEPTDAILPIARLTFVVKSATTSAATPLSFYDQRTGMEGHTYVTTALSPNQNLLSAPLGSLLVTLPAPAALASSSATSSAAAGGTVSSAPASPPAGTQTSFSLIQVQNVRVGTRDNILYVTWDLLNHPKLQGYNLYFGTLQGRYLQRRSVSVASRGAVIRDLPAGKTYYIAVRGVDDSNQETAFSTEASVEIGNPSTASSPIIGALDAIQEDSTETVAPPNPVDHTTVPLESGVPGQSGSPSALLLLLLGSAVIGTLLACRRQVIAHKTLPL